MRMVKVGLPFEKVVMRVHVLLKGGKRFQNVYFGTPYYLAES